MGLSAEQIQHIFDMHPFAFLGGAMGDFPDLAPIRLKAGEKVPVESFNSAMAKNRAMGLDGRGPVISDWLNKGNNVGFVIHRAGVWVLDLDVSDPLPEELATEIARLAPPQVRTPRGGCHCYFRLPDDLADHPDLKAHVNLRSVPDIHLEADLKLGGRRTLVVAPGSRKSDGSEYRVIRHWSTPPVLDPRQLFPSAPIFHRTFGPNEKADFLSDNRPLKVRLARARHYLEKAPVSVSGRGGHACLYGICAHLSSFLRIPPKLAYALVTRPVGSSWNDRCLDGATGGAYPWSKAELLKALEEGRHAVPAYGVILFNLQKEKLAREAQIIKACKIIRRHTHRAFVPVPIREIYDAALSAIGLGADKCSITRFGSALSRLGVPRIRRGTDKVWSLNLRHGIDKLKSDLRKAFPSKEDPAEPLGVEALPQV